MSININIFLQYVSDKDSEYNQIVKLESLTGLKQIYSMICPNMPNRNRQKLHFYMRILITQMIINICQINLSTSSQTIVIIMIFVQNFTNMLIKVIKYARQVDINSLVQYTSSYTKTPTGHVTRLPCHCSNLFYIHIQMNKNSF